MAISDPTVLVVEIDGKARRFRLRNGEIERFENQYAPFGIFELFDQLFGRGSAPQVRHVRDLLALGLVGAGMSDQAADREISELGPEHNMSLRLAAQQLLGVAFLPQAKSDVLKKKAGSRGKSSLSQSDMTPPPK